MYALAKFQAINFGSYSPTKRLQQKDLLLRKINTGAYKMDATYARVSQRVVSCTIMFAMDRGIYYWVRFMMYRDKICEEKSISYNS